MSQPQKTPPKDQGWHVPWHHHQQQEPASTSKAQPAAIRFALEQHPNKEKAALEKEYQVAVKELVVEDPVMKKTELGLATPVLRASGVIGTGDGQQSTTSSSAMAESKDWSGPAHDATALTAPEPEKLSVLDQIWTRMNGSMDDMRTLLDAIRAPLPTQTGDGSELPKSQVKSLGHDNKTIMRDISNLGFNKLEDLCDVIVKAKTDKPLDDKKYLMEYMIQAAASLPDDITSKVITNSFVTTLWNDLGHPPQMLLSSDFLFRQPNGSKNNYAIPHIGAAGMPYARTVTPKTPRDGAMPDPGVIFDAVLARKQPEEHPNRISSVLFYLASIIIHDCFNTNSQDYNISNTSSYLDLAPLYGTNWAEQKRMRTFKDGKIKPDCFSEVRLLQFPPGVGGLLIMFNRYHNWVVEQLALINEDGRFTEDPKNPTVNRYQDQGCKDLLNKRDDDLFQTGRLITCGLYCNIILIDYVRTILNLNRTDSNWQLNPRVDIPQGPARGSGNQVSCEFNLVYRWHASISAKDEAWTTELWSENFHGINPNVPNKEEMERLLDRLKQMGHESYDLEPNERQFPALKSEVFKRKTDGTFNDDDVANILTASIEDCANAMGPQRIPPVMKSIEVLGIRQARTWNVATLNEFRKHFALEPHKTFESITQNKEVAEALKHLYDTPDNVELYPGLVVEDAKDPMLPGSGLCPSYTTSRGVLSDAVALVRGDRYYTESYTPAALTNWGFKEASSDLTIDNGCVFYKLFLRALPNNYDPSSVYVHYPMTVPTGKNGMQDILEKLGKADKYNFDKPTPIAQPNVIFSYNAAVKVLNDQQTFYVTWGKAMEFLMGNAAKNFMLAGDGPANAASRNLMSPALYLGANPREKTKGDEKWLACVRDFYEETTVRLLKEKGFKLAGKNQVDIIRDVSNIAHVLFAAEMFSLPIKTAEFPRGIFTEQQMYLILVAVFICIFFDLDPPKSFPLRQAAREATQQLGKFMTLQVQAIQTGGKLAEKTIEYIKPTSKPLKEYGVHMIAQLLKQQPNVDDLVWGNIMGTLGGMVAPQGQLFGQVLDYFFSEDGRQYLPELHRLSKLNTPEADETLLHYLMEAVRLNGETGVLRWVRKDVTVEDDTRELGKRTLNFKTGDKVMVNLHSASRDPVKFGPDPNALNLNHNLEDYISMGDGPHQCLGQPMTRVALTTMLKVICRLPGLRPAMVTVGKESQESTVKKAIKEFFPGSLKVIPEKWHYHVFLTEGWDTYFPFPTSLKVHWDDAE